jgi:antitoxin (DNA-binding transcriptional repressor) of toxin-antitoxin stability system
MAKVTVDDIQKDLSGYLRRVEAGETLVVVREHEALAEIKPVGSEFESERPAGLCSGEFVVPDDFDEPLPADVLDRFEGR